LAHAGYHALDSLRLEKGYRSWGHDLSPADTPLEAGLGFAVAFDKQTPFLGREALLRQREQGVRRRLAIFTLDDSSQSIFHDEPIWADGKIVGRMTSGGFGFTIERPVGLGYVALEPGEDLKSMAGRRFEIEIAGDRFAARMHLRAPHDPDGTRIRA